MNTKGLVFFENERDDEPRYYVYRNPKFQEGYLHSTQGMDEESAGDYCVVAGTMSYTLEEELRTHFNIDEDVDVEFESVCSTPEYEEIQVFIDHEENTLMSEFATKYARKNSHYVKAKWFDYFDGSDWKSVVIECDIDYAVEMRMVTDEEVLKELTVAVSKFNNHCEGTSKYEEIDGYTLGCAIWANDPWVCYIY